MADITSLLREDLSIQDATPHVGMNPKKVVENVGILDGTGVTITLRLESLPNNPVIPRMPTMSFNPIEQEGM